MCGIAGIYNINKEPVSIEKLLAMTRVIRHRGPDDEGFLVANPQKNHFQHAHHDETITEIKAVTPQLEQTEPGYLCFGFRRLSILDLSPKGHQPMCDEDSGNWIVFNGEIFNYIEIREELKKNGFQFRSGSDTEVILKAYRFWGEACLSQFNGMWSFSLWDQQKQRLFCARDRFGIKPFFYSFNGKSFVWGSEVKQLLETGLSREVNEEVIFKSLKIGSYLINSNNSYFKSIKILPHSHFLIADETGIEIKPYYDLNFTGFETSKLSFEEACEAYRELFADAVRLRMRSDVEVGSALSGGLDSSAIVSLASGYTSQKFKTFSSYYNNELQYDERKWIHLVAEKTGVEDHYVSAGAEQVLRDLETITWHHDYPVPGSSPVAQYYVMQLARKEKVTVMLDGQGSDEITGGYNHAFYRYYADLLRQCKWGRFVKEYPDYVKYNPKGGLFAKLVKLGAVSLFSESRLYKEEAKRNLINPTTLIYNDYSIFDNIKDLPIGKLSNFLYNQMMSTSIQTLLHFEDRNSMAHSVESRVPFLDYRFVEFAFSLPSHYKIHKNFGKYIHREALKTVVPKEIMERKDKIGFLAPGERFWMRGEMKPMLDSLFCSTEFKNRSIFNQKLILEKWNEYQAGNDKNASLLWQVMALELWFRKFTS